MMQYDDANGEAFDEDTSNRKLAYSINSLHADQFANAQVSCVGRA